MPPKTFIDAIDQIHAPIREAAEGLERFFRTPVQVKPTFVGVLPR